MPDFSFRIAKNRLGTRLQSPSYNQSPGYDHPAEISCLICLVQQHRSHCCPTKFCQGLLIQASASLYHVHMCILNEIQLASFRENWIISWKVQELMHRGRLMLSSASKLNSSLNVFCLWLILSLPLAIVILCYCQKVLLDVWSHGHGWQSDHVFNCRLEYAGTIWLGFMWLSVLVIAERSEATNLDDGSPILS